MNKLFWREWRECFELIGEDANVRCVIVSGAGSMFTAGLDVADHAEVFSGTVEEGQDVARRALRMRRFIQGYQQAFSAMENIPQPVIACVHSACVGGGVDLICACDIRLCTKDAWFSIKEVDIGMAADVGTLQRLPKIVGNDSLVRELAYLGRRMDSTEAARCGLVSSVHEDFEHTYAAALAMAKEIAAKSPIAIAGTKRSLVHSRDHSVPAGLDFIANWNMSMLQTEVRSHKSITDFSLSASRDAQLSISSVSASLYEQDMGNAFMATSNKQQPIFSKL